MKKIKEPIKILKPYKLSRQKNESPTDAVEALSFISNIVKSTGPNDVEVVSNLIDGESDIISNPENIVTQMIDAQNATYANIEGTGKRIYSMIYKFPKEFNVDIMEVTEMAGELLAKYPNFQSIAVVNKDSNADVFCGVSFNNYSIDGVEKMSKRYRPYHMSNIYNRYINGRTAK